MAGLKTADTYAAGHGAATCRPDVIVAILALAAGIPALALVAMLPAPLVLPTLSLVALAAAGGFAALAWWIKARRHTDHINLWDIAGACAFIGFAAAMISQPEQVLKVFG